MRQPKSLQPFARYSGHQRRLSFQLRYPWENTSAGASRSIRKRQSQVKILWITWANFKLSVKFNTGKTGRQAPWFFRINREFWLSVHVRINRDPPTVVSLLIDQYQSPCKTAGLPLSLFIFIIKYLNSHGTYKYWCSWLSTLDKLEVSCAVADGRSFKEFSCPFLQKQPKIKILLKVSQRTNPLKLINGMVWVLIPVQGTTTTKSLVNCFKKKSPTQEFFLSWTSDKI